MKSILVKVIKKIGQRTAPKIDRALGSADTRIGMEYLLRFKIPFFVCFILFLFSFCFCSIILYYFVILYLCLWFV